MENHFVEEGEKVFYIDNLEFSYIPVTAGEENEWLNEYIIYKNTIDENGQNKLITTTDHSKLNKLKLSKLKKTPYTREVIKKIINIDKDWNELNTDQKWNLLSKLKPKIFDEIIKNINKIDIQTEETKNV